MKKIFLYTLLLLLSLVKIQAQEYKVYESLEEALKNPDKVYVLDLHNQDLSTFPAEILTLKNLKQLDLRDNNITEIPEGIKELKNLEQLSMFTNQLQNVPNAIGELENLKMLDLGNNPLENLPSEVAKLSNLEKLYLQNTKIVKKNQKQIKKLLPDCEIRFSF